MYLVSLIFFRLIRRLLGVSRTVIGKEHIPMHGAVIIVANHIGNTDVPRVSDVVYPRRIHWWANDSLFSARKLYAVHRRDGSSVLLSALTTALFVPVVKYSGTIPVVRKEDGDPQYAALVNSAAIRRSKIILRDGGVIGVYINGGFGRDEFFPGFAVVLKKVCRGDINIPVWVLPVEIRPHKIHISEPFDGRALVENRCARDIGHKMWETINKRTYTNETV